MDTLSKQERSALMAKIRGRDTQPELMVRSLIHRMGYRFRLHDGKLPGRPDIVLPRHGKIVLVHGCFWHQHTGCARLPKSRQGYWLPKLEQNCARDARNLRALRRLGWQVLVVWECQISRPSIETKLRRFLET
ncbi:MAG: very short patch repair endonuclease [Acidobacteriaceae bacterium]